MSALGQAILLTHLLDNRVSGFAAFGESSLTISDWCALRVLMAREESGRKSNLSTIASLLGVSRQRGKQVIDHLVQRGYVTTLEPEEKERVRFAAVTEKGKAAAGAVDAKLELQFVNALDRKPARAERLVKLLKGLEAASRRAGSTPARDKKVPPTGRTRTENKRASRGGGKGRTIEM